MPRGHPSDYHEHGNRSCPCHIPQEAVHKPDPRTANMSSPPPPNLGRWMYSLTSGEKHYLAVYPAVVDNWLQEDLHR